MSKLTDFPCPFCGSEPEDIPVEPNEWEVVACLQDGCPIKGHEFGIEEWETRADRSKKASLAEKVCETLAGYRRDGEFFDPETTKYLDAWMEI